MGIRIYLDKGVCKFSLNLLLKAFNTENLTPKLINSSQLNKGDWVENTQLLVIPGGRDIPYHKALKGKGTSHIRKYVESGGCYLGICAGAYFGCASIVFEEGSPLEVTGSRELAFFPGQGFGPAYGNEVFQYETSQGARLASLQLSEGGRNARVFFNGGCLFKHAEAYAGVNIIARYADLPGRPAAIVVCQIGKGKAILSGVHPEYNSKHVETDDTHLKRLVPEMAIAEEGRRQLFRSILDEAIRPYTMQLKNRYVDCAKAPGLNDRKSANIII